MVNGEHETSRDSPALFADVAMAKTESSNEGNQGTSFTCVSNWFVMVLYCIVLAAVEHTLLYCCITYFSCRIAG